MLFPGKGRKQNFGFLFPGIFKLQSKQKTMENKKMKKIIALCCLVGFFASVSAAVAGDMSCKVVSVEGATVVMDCGGDAGNVAAGDKVEIAKKKKAVEGC